jgi:hypothetical protein
MESFYIKILISVGLLLNRKPSHGKPRADCFLFVVDYFEDPEGTEQYEFMESFYIKILIAWGCCLTENHARQTPR